MPALRNTVENERLGFFKIHHQDTASILSEIALKSELQPSNYNCRIISKHTKYTAVKILIGGNEAKHSNCTDVQTSVHGQL